MKYEHRIVIGDWSHDGHNQDAYFTFQCSHEEKEVKKAYLKAVKQCKVSLHEQDGKGKRLSGVTPVCCRYEDSTINAPALKALKELGVNLSFRESKFNQNDKGEDEMGCSPQDIAYLFFEMVKTQIPDFEYKLIKEKKTINGFWSSDFNINFGYGCFTP